MKLLYIANARIPTEKAHGVAIMKTCEAFGRQGVETILILPRRRNAITENPFLYYGIEESFKIVKLPTLDLMNTPLIPMRFAFLLQTITFYGSVVLYLLFKTRTAILYTRDYGSILLRALGYRLVYECHHMSKRKRLFFALSTWANYIVVISQALKNTFIAKGFEDCGIVVAPSGVDMAIFDIPFSKDEARKKLDLALHQTYAVYTGNFNTMGEDKGLREVITAIAMVSDILFIAVGGSDNDIARYRTFAEEKGVGERVILRGYVPQRELALYQKAADMLLMPFPDTPHFRGHMSPVKMFEYMASKRPIVATDLPTIREVLDEETAFLVPPGNSEALADAMRTLAENKGLGERLANRAFERVHTYTWEARTKHILSHLA